MSRFTIGRKINLFGAILEAIGFAWDILHHFDIGVEAEEGLVTVPHLFIFGGFLIAFAGLVILWSSGGEKSRR
ncbi:hypothetical protein HYW30_00700 [Candidatus Azambacteria bacterium]|nr:hypothetical protein [Candidatus Azambacteria bacterium]